MAKYEIEMIVAGTPLHGGMGGNPYGQNPSNPWGSQQAYGMGMGLSSYYGGQMGMMNPQYLQQQAAYLQQPYAQQYYEAAYAQSAAYAAGGATDGRNRLLLAIFSLYFE